MESHIEPVSIYVGKRTAAPWYDAMVRGEYYIMDTVSCESSFHATKETANAQAARIQEFYALAGRETRIVDIEDQSATTLTTV